MTDKTLKRLSRKDLLEILIRQTKEMDQLKQRIAELEEELQKNQISYNKIGSLAEAALAMNGVYESAQAAADQYLGEIAAMKADAENQYNAILTDAQKRADAILNEAETVYRQKMDELNAYIDAVNQQARQYYQQADGDEFGAQK